MLGDLLYGLVPKSRVDLCSIYASLYLSTVKGKDIPRIEYFVEGKLIYIICVATATRGNVIPTLASVFTWVLGVYHFSVFVVFLYMVRVSNASQVPGYFHHVTL